MSGFTGSNKPKGPPKGYIPGLGRGAAGFTTRSDVGPAAPSAGAGADASSLEISSGVGSRSAEVRAAKVRAAQAAQAGGGGGGGAYDSFGGYERGGGAVEGQYDDDDDEADRVWAAIDERMQNKRKRKHNNKSSNIDNSTGDGNNSNNVSSNIAAPFRDLKAKLADVSQAEWANIPSVGDYSLKFKQDYRKRQDVFTPLTDSLLEQRTRLNTDATASRSMSAIAGTATAATTATDGFQSVVTNMSGLSAARGTVLGMSLDKMSDNVMGQTNVDPQGYLTSLSTGNTINNANNVADVHKARILLQSVRDTNPHHAAGWIAAARVEEAAGKMAQARVIIQQACRKCGDKEDVWLEAARLHPATLAKSFLAAAVRRIPTSTKLFLAAAQLESSDSNKRAVLRKALEANPTSVQLWKAAVELEESADHARILLSVAVEKVPENVELWLALARLETYENAQKVLNRARKALPADRSIWMAAARLEESQLQNDATKAQAIVAKIISRAVPSLAKNHALVSRAQWLQEAEASEAAGAPVTAAAIVQETISMQVDDLDRVRTWSDDAASALSRGRVATARAILNVALTTFPTKRSFWMQAVELERKYGCASSADNNNDSSKENKALDEVLAAACERLPRVEVFWLLRAKEKWTCGQVDASRSILAQAFERNPDSQAIWLAAAKLEWETGETERARLLLQRARERAPTDRVYMKSALLEREQQQYTAALQLIEQGISKYPKFAKLYMMGGQICSDDVLPKQKSSLDRARKFYQRGLQECPHNTVLWTLASRLEERAATFDPSKQQQQSSSSTTNSSFTTTTKARALLDLGRLKNPNNPELWLESVRLERRAGNAKLSDTLLAKALQECPKSALLLSESIRVAPRVEQKSKSTLAIQQCPDDARVIVAVACLFAKERKKHDKARKWFDRAVILNPDFGDAWARYYAFEKTAAVNAEQQQQASAVKERCVAAEPKHGEIWTSVTKDMANRAKTVGECLELAAQKVLQQQQQQQQNGVN